MAGPKIIGGDDWLFGPSWIVQVDRIAPENPDEAIRSTGVQVNDNWVLRERGKVEDSLSFQVYHSLSTVDRGEPADVERYEISPMGDLALLHLAFPYPLDYYPVLDVDFTPSTWQRCLTGGYGATQDGVQSEDLRGAYVITAGPTLDLSYPDGLDQRVIGDDAEGEFGGLIWNGDNGAPLIVAWQKPEATVVGIGVDAGGGHAGTALDPHGWADFAVFKWVKDWLLDTIAQP